MLFCSLTANAYDFEVNGIYYNLISTSDLIVEVTSGDNYYSGNVIIPSTINYSGKTMTVTSIGWDAFSNCSELTSISIPNTVTNISTGAFSGCKGTIDIVFESGNIVYDSRDNCNAIIETNSNTLIVGFSNTTIPNSVTSIGDDAFAACNGLTSITIPNSVTSIGNGAFWACYGLTNVTIGNSVTSIGNNAFAACYGLTSITIPNSVTSIGDNAFAACYGLTSITIPNSVTSIGNSAFKDSGWWNNQQDGMMYKDGWLIGYKNSRPIFDIVIQDGTKKIANNAFAGCSGITSVTIPNCVTSIGEYAFSDCDGLTSITIPDRVTSIGERAFEGCSGLTSVTIHSSITNLNGVFFNCNAIEKLELNCPTIESWFSGQQSIKEVVIGNSVTSIGENAFWNCSGLTSVTIGNSITSIGRNAFSGCSELTSITIPNSVTNIGDWAFTDCLELTNITIPNSVTSIGEYAFSGSGLTSVTIGNSVTTIGNGAFFRCDDIEKLELNCPTIESWFSSRQSIKEVVIGNSVTSIGENAFNFCSELTNVTIGDSVTSIGNGAFRNCSELTSITIPNRVTNIGEYAFFGCSGLINVTIPNSVTNIGYRAFMECNAIEKLELDCPTIESWFYGKPFVKEVIIGNSVTSIGNNAFAYCSRLTSVTIGDSVTSIGNSAFSSCPKLTSITIPSCVTNIGNSAFDNCSELTRITIPNSVTSIGERAFEGTAWYNNQPEGIVYAGKVLYKYKGTMPENTDITIKEGTLGIASGAFQYCYGLTSITIPNNVSNIGERAFEGCYALKKINSFIPAEKLFVPEDNAFEGVNKETCTLYVPEGDVSAYESTAGWNEFKHIVDFDPYFTITYLVDGEVYSTGIAEYGSEIILIDEPTREGHTFSGWSEAPKSMPADNITIYGTFTANKYFITFKIGDEVIFSAPIEYGASIVAPEVPEKEGYSFDGWSEMPETVPAHDVIVYGTFTKLIVETIVINDSDFSFSMEENTECSEITYIRTFNNTNWQALYVPIEIPITEEILADFEVADINNVHQYDHNDDNVIDETVIEIFKVTSGTLEANYPYLIRAKETGEKTIMVTDATLYATAENSIDCSSVREKFTFTGTYSRMSYNELTPNEGYYTLNDGEWQPMTEGAALDAFRFYLKVDSRNGNAVMARTIRMRIVGENDGNDDDVTSIEEAEIINQNSAVIYDLQGRRVENPTKGIYIVDGKKVVL